MFSSVTGTSSTGGTATLTATLTSADGSPLMGETVGFTVDGAYAGIADDRFPRASPPSDRGAHDTAAVGHPDVGGIVAYFASNTNFLSTTGTGDLVVTSRKLSDHNKQPGLRETAVFGGTASLQAATPD